jgi:hypothetical protein
LAYQVRFTYYLLGPLFLAHALATLAALVRGGSAAPPSGPRAAPRPTSSTSARPS